jgi:hypothetical protein
MTPMAAPRFVENQCPPMAVTVGQMMPLAKPKRKWARKNW